MPSECSFIDRLRAPKIFDMSIFDWFASILVAVLLGLFLGIKRVSSWTVFLFAWMLFGVLVHLLFGVKTMFGFYLGLNEKPVRKIC